MNILKKIEDRLYYETGFGRFCWNSLDVIVRSWYLLFYVAIPIVIVVTAVNVRLMSDQLDRIEEAQQTKELGEYVAEWIEKNIKLEAGDSE